MQNKCWKNAGHVGINYCQRCTQKITQTLEGEDAKKLRGWLLVKDRRIGDPVVEGAVAVEMEVAPEQRVA